MTQTHDKVYYRSHPPVDFSKAEASDRASLSYKLFTKDNPDEFVVLTEENVGEQIRNKDAKTVLIVHGWTSNESTPWYAPLKEAYLHQNYYNVIYLDWSVYGNMRYSVSAANCKPVGEFIATFLKKSGILPEKIHLIGHSLGSHVCAFVGKAYEKEFNQKIGRITALDPAGPQWSNTKKEERLSELDADFVDVTHTDIGIFGYSLPCGHVDFYPNGGTNQPGCTEEKQKANCNHRRATKLYIESINTKISAKEIDITEDDDYNITIIHKENPKRVIFGEHVDSNARGVYYFETNHETPFLKDDL